ncbi:MAG TPA: NADH-quinone oxidoreductase subunit NuoH [Actinobacteria bacterium]|nr:NADH-quinone oxidoreductase subunit NuoH [Actinomycetota bacterium]
MDTLITLGLILLKTLIALGLALANLIFYYYIERKVLADLQIRYGPMRVGFHGTLQQIADLIKLIIKEDVIPKAADWWLFVLAPFIAFVPSFLLFMTIPISENLVVANMDLGIFYLFGILTIVPISVLVAGWSSNSKYSLIGGLRGAAQQISYEIPLLASMLGVIMLAGSFNLVDIVKAQQGYYHLFGWAILPKWFIFAQPLAFLFFFTAALADTQRTPFDIPEAESELVQGYNTEYSSIKFALFLMGEYLDTIIISAVAVIAFFGGWSGFEPIPGVVWFFLKTYMVIFFIIWLRATLPRIRIDQLMDFGWKILLPLTLVNVMVTGFLMIG